MNEYLGQVYYSAQIIPSLKEMLLRRRRQNNYSIQEEWDMLLEPIKTLSIETMKQNTELGKQIWNNWASIMDNGKNGDIVRMGDELEEFIPIVCESMRAYDVKADEEDYTLYSSKSGFLTMLGKADDKLYHSEIDPMWEAYELAELLFKPEITEYHIAGCDLGYLPYQLHNISSGSADIYVYDVDAVRRDLAYEYGVLDWIPTDKLHICIASNKEIEKTLNQAFSESGKAIYINKWFRQSYYDAQDDITRLDAINDTRIYIGKQAETNKYRNLKNVVTDIAKYVENNITDKWRVVAGGPSLDDCIDTIKDKEAGEKTVCAATVLKKLLDLGIEPDVTVALDPLNRTFEQVAELDVNVPICINSCANWQFGEYYTGKKYLMDRPDIGNVSTMAIELAIMAGAKEIELFGLDLAYPMNRTHASGTMDATEIKDTNLVKVASSDGGEVDTKEEFLTYIQEIEDIVSAHKEICFINYSKHGALIKGTKVVD